ERRGDLLQRSMSSPRLNAVQAARGRREEKLVHSLRPYLAIGAHAFAAQEGHAERPADQVIQILLALDRPANSLEGAAWIEHQMRIRISQIRESMPRRVRRELRNTHGHVNRSKIVMPERALGQIGRASCR